MFNVIPLICIILVTELNTLTRQEKNNENVTAEFSRDYSHITLKATEQTYRFEWLTSQDFYDIAETIDKEYPIRNKVQLQRTGPEWRNIVRYREKPLREIESPEKYDRLDIIFEDFLVSWEENYSERRIDEPNQVRLYSSGAGIWPFEHLYAETAERDEKDVLELLRDVESFLGVN